MKKIMTLIAIMMMCISMTAQAQEKENAIGFNYAYMTGSNNVSNFGIGVKYDRFLSEALRIEGRGTYFFKQEKNHTNWFDLSANFHYLFNVAEKTNVYPIFGFSTMFGHTGFEVPGGEKVSDSHARFGCNSGVGAQYNITDDFGVTFEAKYKIMKDFGNFNLAIGCVVLF